MTIIDKDKDTFLRSVLAVQTKSRQAENMIAFVTAEAIHKGYALTEDKGNLYLTKGEAELYPCFVAHTDTVHPIIEHFSVHEIEGAIFGWNRAESRMHGIGGDDKVGVFLALQLLRDLPYGKAALFRDEEVGCLGAGEVDLTFFADCAFAVEADRRGIEDVVTKAANTELCSQEFKDALAQIMKNHNRKEELFGLSTDVATLKRKGLDICALNLSCGYWYPHGKDEVVLINDVMDTLAFMHEITATMSAQRWEHTYVAPVYTPAKSYTPKAKETNKDKEPIQIHGGWYGDDDADYGMWGANEWKASQKRREEVLKREAAKYDGKINYFSAYRFDEAIPQIGDLDDARARARANDQLDVARIKKPKEYLAPPFMETDEDMTRVDYMIADVICPECGEMDMTVNYDGVKARNATKPDLLMAYCWECRCDWFSVEEVLSGKAYENSDPMIVEMEKQNRLEIAAEKEQQQQLALTATTEEVAK